MNKHLVPKPEHEETVRLMTELVSKIWGKTSMLQALLEYDKFLVEHDLVNLTTNE